MASKRPRVLGLEDLLALQKPLKERPSPLVYFSDKEFDGLLEGAVRLKRAPRGGRSFPTFEPWLDGGMVQSKCESPPGQICVGRWTPAGPGHGSGVFFDCRCSPVGGVDPPQLPCRLRIDSSPRFGCSGGCSPGEACRLEYFRNPKSGTTILSCECRAILVPNP
jgi:hypothetical protein